MYLVLPWYSATPKLDRYTAEPSKRSFSKVLRNWLLTDPWILEPYYQKINTTSNGFKKKCYSYFDNKLKAFGNTSLSTKINSRFSIPMDLPYTFCFQHRSTLTQMFCVSFLAVRSLTITIELGLDILILMILNIISASDENDWWGFQYLYNKEIRVWE